MLKNCVVLSIFVKALFGFSFVHFIYTNAPEGDPESNNALNVTSSYSSPQPKKNKRELRMSKLARQHLSDENNANNYPRALGIDFPGN